jgi:hypothetical protein
MSKVYSSPKQKSSQKPGIKSKKMEVHGNGNGRIEHIQRRAYEIYQQRLQNQLPGDMISDWVKAEQEINRQSCQQDYCKIGE